MYEIGRTELTYNLEDAERKGWERNESIIVFHVPEEEYNLLKDKSLGEIRDYLERNTVCTTILIIMCNQEQGTRIMW